MIAVIVDGADTPLPVHGLRLRLELELAQKPAPELVVLELDNTDVVAAHTHRPAWRRWKIDFHY